ncbi:MAG: hypothetical protein LBD11_05675 [Candidatus Peribacteria bacterium]|jgi:hypothetical protein|nr:hypothetical protein [Candidatus Peribacteria bacterium]
MKSKSFLKYQKRANLGEYLLYYALNVLLFFIFLFVVVFFQGKVILVATSLIFLSLLLAGRLIMYVYIHAGFSRRLQKTKAYLERKVVEAKNATRKAEMLLVIQEIDDIFKKGVKEM